MPLDRDTMSQSDGTVESSMLEHPQRVSALYQYHNAPEVAPAHGLEYDDSNYPHSDKYPVIHTMPSYDSKWTTKKYGAAHEGRPPRIIFGMKTRTFLVVAAIMIMVIVGAAVGGAVGGTTIKSNTSMPSMVPTSAPATSSSATPSSTSSISTATASAFSAPLPTFGPIGDCPEANNTVYSSGFYSGGYGTVTPSSKLNFTRYCDVANPLAPSNIQLSTFVYSFEDCIEACASLNFYNKNGGCTVAAFRLNATRPSNCWVGAMNLTYDNLTMSANVDVAILQS